MTEYCLRDGIVVGFDGSNDLSMGSFVVPGHKPAKILIADGPHKS